MRIQGQGDNLPLILFIDQTEHCKCIGMGGLLLKLRVKS